MNLSKLIVFSAILLVPIYLKAQDTNYVSPVDTMASQTYYNQYPVKMSSSLIDLIDRDVKIKAKRHKTDGFRIQLYYGNREEAVKLKAHYQDLLQTEHVYVEYEQPYFKTKIGDFRTELEAERYMRAMGEHCSGCFIVRDDIEFPSIQGSSSPPPLDTPR
ncbi:MAG: SPOR domain-containing protein [Flavobacteriales bacterium]|nr:SPOR domain-containing protein [Flavobacteriales bacterium]